MSAPSAPVVEALFRFPVKSMQGEAVTAVRVENGHVAGDRQWAVIDVESGVTLSAKRHGALLEAAARTESSGTVVLTIPGLGEHEAGAPGTDEALSGFLGRPVVLSRRGTEAPPIELLVDALDDDSEIIAFPVPEGHFADLADAHILTTSSLEAASRLYPDGDWDIRRFRPTMLVSGAGEGFAEDGWIGSKVGFGAEPTAGVILEVFMPTVRCSLPPRAQPGLPRDTAMARVLKEQHDYCLGVYAACRQDGTISRGDAVVVTD